MRRAVVAAFLAIIGIALWAPAAHAHPLGNATTNQYLGLRVTPDRVHVDYVLDQAELPTYQTCQSHGCTPDRATAMCATATADVHIAVNNRPGRLTLDGATLTLAAGAAGLDTLRLECRLSLSVRVSEETSVRVENAAFPGTVGWREITAVGDRVTVQTSDVPAESASKRLTEFADDLLASPPDVRTTELIVRPGGPALMGSDAAPPAAAGGAFRGLDRLSNEYMSFVTDRRSSAGFVLLAMLVSVALGALHALAPGHGKTVMAAYAVGAHGTRRQIGAIGLTVAATHTAGVAALGVLFTITSTAPNRIYPWLACASGLLLTFVGIGLLRSALHLHRGHVHGHGHGHDHAHRGHAGRRRLIGMGVAGGLVPSPSAVLVLLGGLALGRPTLGVALVVAYGLGMAMTLVGVGVLLARGRSLIDRRTARLPRLVRLIPLATSSVVLVVGLGTVAGAASAF